MFDPERLLVGGDERAHHVAVVEDHVGPGDDALAQLLGHGRHAFHAVPVQLARTCG
jgi:hypothetical protein